MKKLLIVAIYIGSGEGVHESCVKLHRNDAVFG